MQFRWEPRTTEQVEAHGGRIAVLEYSAVPLEEALPGYHQPLSRPTPFRQLRVDLHGGGAVLEPGALQWLRGDIELQATSTAGGGGGLGGLLRGAVTAAATGEGMFKTAYRGQGQIHTEPSRLHYLLGELEGEDLIVDDGAFVAVAGNMTVGRHVNRGLMNTLGSGEGRIQPKLTGSGVFALQAPVHPSEVQVLTLRGDTLKVDGNLVLAYSGSLQFAVEKSARGLIGAAKTGEGFVQVYRGSGRVWLAPTLPVSGGAGMGAGGLGGGVLREVLGN